MSTLIKTVRMPAKYRVLASGITEIVYNATPDVIPVLPGTRWLEQRREREARVAAAAAEAAALLEETQIAIEEEAPLVVPMIDTELATDFCPVEDLGELELSWTDRMRVASTKLIKRQNLWESATL